MLCKGCARVPRQKLHNIRDHHIYLAKYATPAIVGGGSWRGVLCPHVQSVLDLFLRKTIAKCFARACADKHNMAIAFLSGHGCDERRAFSLLMKRHKGVDIVTCAGGGLLYLGRPRTPMAETRNLERLPKLGPSSGLQPGLEPPNSAPMAMSPKVRCQTPLCLRVQADWPCAT